MNKWDERFIDLAIKVSEWSKDPKTKVGCVIADNEHRVIGVGFNGFPRGVQDSNDLLNSKQIKNLMMQHAETNAILNSNSSVKGSVLYVTHRPCCRCAGAIIQAGVGRVVYLDPHPENWSNDRRDIMELMLLQAGVILDEIKAN